MKSKLKDKKKWLYRCLMSLMIGFMSLTNMTLPTRAAENSLTKHFYNDINYQMSKGGYTAWGAGFNLAMNGKHVLCRSNNGCSIGIRIYLKRFQSC